MQAMWLEACDELGAPVTVRGLSQIPVADTADIPAVTADRKALPPADEVRLAAVLEAIDAALKNSLGNGDAVQELIAALSDLAFAQALEDELLARVNQRPMLFRWLISEVLSRVNRAPIGDTILASDSTHST